MLKRIFSKNPLTIWFVITVMCVVIVTNNGCGRAEPNAHQRVMLCHSLSNDALKTSMGDEPSDEELITGLLAHLSRISKFSLSGCSPEFRNDYIALINSLNTLIAELQRSKEKEAQLDQRVQIAFDELMKAEIAMKKYE